MGAELQTRVTKLLGAVAKGDPIAGEELLPLVYNELRILARSWLNKEKNAATLQPTALVHEAYLRLVGDQDLEWDDRGHFFAAAATAMRRILVERARRKLRVKHGGELVRQDMEDEPESGARAFTEMIALDEGLQKLKVRDARMHQMVMLRYFGGLSVEDVARILAVSTRTINREWQVARVMLRHWMSLPGGLSHG